MVDPTSDAASHAPQRGEIWLADLSPTQGHEQAGRRPVMIISVDAHNSSRAGLVIALPLTGKVRRMAGRVSLAPPEGGLKSASDILCDHVRAFSQARLLLRWGEVSSGTLATVESVLRVLMGL